MTAIARPAPCAAARPIALPAYTRWLLALVTTAAARLLLVPSLLAPAALAPTPVITSAPAPALVSSPLAPAATPVWVAPQPEPVAPSIP